MCLATPEWYTRVVHMALAMSRPFKHPKTGIYWLRKRVPADLVGVLGRAEEKRSLKTRDAAEAKRLHLQALAEIEARWLNLRAGPAALNEREAHVLASRVYTNLLDIYHDNPSKFTFWLTDFYAEVSEQLAKKLSYNASDFNEEDEKDNPFFFIPDPDRARYDDASRLELQCWDSAIEILKVEGLVVDAVSRQKLARALADAFQRASLELARQARGEFGEGGRSLAQPIGHSRSPQKQASEIKKAFPFAEAMKLWVAEKQPAERTVYEWTRVMRSLEGFLGHADVHHVSPEDLIRWKNSMVEAGLKPKTIRDGKLAPIRAILQCAVDNRRLQSNTAERINVDVKAKAVEARRGYSDAEAATVLRAALKQTDPVLRWVPWLCAYSGARVSEVCQLRVQDVRQQDGIWCLWFAAEAGPLKNVNSERAVPLHTALVDGGFLDFVKSLPAGPIFSHLPPDKFGKRGGNGTKVLGRFVRGLKLTDTRLAPNHSWRHRFKTAGRRYGLALDIVNAITGHGRKTVADAYGEFPISALERELAKIPALDLA